MDTYQVRYSDLAFNDLENIYNYISVELYAPETAEGKVSRIRNEIRKLNTFPAKFKLSENPILNARNIHQFTVNNYYVFYSIEEENQTVNIARII